MVSAFVVSMPTTQLPLLLMINSGVVRQPEMVAQLKVNFSRMPPKFMQTYPHIVENRRITFNGTINFETDIMKKSSLLN